MTSNGTSSGCCDGGCCRFQVEQLRWWQVAETKRPQARSPEVCAAGIGSSSDGVAPEIQNKDRLLERARRSRRLGFGAKLAFIQAKST